MVNEFERELMMDCSQYGNCYNKREILLLIRDMLSTNYTKVITICSLTYCVKMSSHKMMYVENVEEQLKRTVPIKNHRNVSGSWRTLVDAFDSTISRCCDFSNSTLTFWTVIHVL